MTFDPLRRGRSNRDRRDQAFVRSVIAEAERRRRDAAIHHALTAPDDVVGPACMRVVVPPTIAMDDAFREPYVQGYRHALSAVRAFYKSHPIDIPEPDHCIFCGDPLSGNCEARDEHYPYCSARCGIEAENDND